MREGPSGSHQLLAREEKWVSSSEDMEEDEEWCRTLSTCVVVVLLRPWRTRRVMFRAVPTEVRDWLRIIICGSAKQFAIQQGMGSVPGNSISSRYPYEEDEWGKLKEGSLRIQSVGYTSHWSIKEI